MTVTSQIARIRVGPNSRNKTTLYTATRVTKNVTEPPSYTTEIIQYTDAKGSGGVVIGSQYPGSNGKIIWNDNASATAKKYQSFVAKASTTQVKSISSDIATTAQEKAALNKVSGSNNAAIDSGTDSARQAGLRGQGNRPLAGNQNRQGGNAGVSNQVNNIGTSDNDIDDNGIEPSEAAKGTRTSFGGVLVYPSTLRKENQDTLWFTMMEYKSKGLVDSKGSLGPSERAGNRKSLGKVVLPIPAGIGDSNNTSWSQGEMNAGQMALAKIALTGITKGLKEAGSEAGDILGNIGGNKEEVKDAIAQQIAGAATGDSKALMQRSTGQVINPNMEMLFNGPSLRTFSFTFNFTARSAAEGRTILRIIRFFKQGMSPIKSASNLFLKSPHTFKLEYKNGGRSHRALNKFKECACTTCGLQYTPDGNYATYEDGIMTKYQMTLGFSELEPIFNSDYAQFSKNEIGY